MSDWVAGVDGCRGGWLVVLRPLTDPCAVRCHLLKTFGEVLTLPEAPQVVAVDIPIGLPETATIGGRAADSAARAVLGDRQSAVFAVPSRAAVMQSDYGDACRVALATSDPPRKVSKQTFYLFPKIREVDAHMTPALQGRVMEVHPEVAFWVLNGFQPLSEPKKVKSRPYEPGLALRLGLLAAAGYPTDVLQSAVFRSAEAGADDVLDAAANSAAAARIARGEGRRFPDDPARDAKGLRMEIWG